MSVQNTFKVESKTALTYSSLECDHNQCSSNCPNWPISMENEKKNIGVKML